MLISFLPYNKWLIKKFSFMYLELSTVRHDDGIVINPWQAEISLACTPHLRYYKDVLTLSLY